MSLLCEFILCISTSFSSQVGRQWVGVLSGLKIQLNYVLYVITWSVEGTCMEWYRLYMQILLYNLRSLDHLLW